MAARTAMGMLSWLIVTVCFGCAQQKSDSKDPLPSVATHKQAPEPKVLASWEYPGMTVDQRLYRAASEPELTATRRFLKEGADPNHKEYGQTLLLRILSDSSGPIESVPLLLEFGAEVNVTDPQGYTPLMYAVKQSDVKVVKLILDHSARVNARSRSGQTALRLIRSGDLSIGTPADHKAVERLLVKYGARE